MSARAAVTGLLVGSLGAVLQMACNPCGSGEPVLPPAGTYALREMEADPDPGQDPTSYELTVTVTAPGDVVIRWVDPGVDRRVALTYRVEAGSGWLPPDPVTSRRAPRLP